MQVADLLLKIITDNESWVFVCDPEMKLSPGNGTPTHHPERKVIKYHQQIMLITWVCFSTNFSL
jgi:hypothetical protein